jgi:biotin-(acetyl-CoA carboxylase) ligase
MSIGIGINVNSRPENQEAAYCAQMRGRPLSRRDLLLSFLNEWENLKKTPPGELEKLWNAAAWGRGREVQAREDKGGSGERTLEQGVFLGMDARGRGILKTAKGKKRFFPPGTVSFVFGSPSGEMETQFSKDH